MLSSELVGMRVADFPAFRLADDQERYVIDDADGVE
jgi:hypothetical protein